MKKNKNFNKDQKLVKSTAQAKVALDMLLGNSQKNLESGISELGVATFTGT
ncbi:hypothetical protein [Flavobacterium geliluteum]|uniref:Uncharacterized protein n=1 Tax=Flavobacterium geliluteum TaxID=2816120 RepID=A0A941AYA8_9FLAO|nr:hypothetical protein [Flavobacterium geliluteum]MBP4139136.1 hypothetical protein [Flavobacterium geliluteum]